MITEEQLRQIMPNLNPAKSAAFMPHLQAAMDEFEINTPLRAAAFLAQLAHESGQFRFMEEIWGPTAAQRRYEPVTSLSRTLGNTQAGDGRRFKGRGPIQLTGRANYQRFGQLLGLDLVNNPELAATPEVAFRIAGLYWQSRGLNAFADSQNFREITRRINGGFNGLADRQMFYERAKRVLGTATRAVPGGAPMRAGARSMPGGGGGASRSVPRDLSRGFMPGDPQMAKLLSEDGGGGAKKRASKKTAAKKSAKKGASKKGGAKKAAAGKGGAKRAGAKKGAAKKGAARKGAAKKGAAKRGGAKGGAKKGGAKKGGARKGAGSRR